MANESIGKVRPDARLDIAQLAGGLEVRKKQRGSHPLYLWSASTGPVFLNTPQGQDWILERAVMFDEGGNDPHPDPEPAPAADPEPEPEPVKGSGGGTFFD